MLKSHKNKWSAKYEIPKGYIGKKAKKNHYSYDDIVNTNYDVLKNFGQIKNKSQKP